MTRAWLVRVETAWVCFGFVVGPSGRVTEAAPIARWTIGKPGREILAYWRHRGATVTWSEDQ